MELKRWIPVLCASALIAMPVMGFEVKLTDEERAQCAEEGGCLPLTREHVKGLMLKAYEAGKAQCEPRIDT